MGDVIRANAAIDDILKDARTAYDRSVAKGGIYEQRAKQILVPVLSMMDAVDAELATEEKATAPLIAAVTAENADADAEVLRISDDVWNDVGRPANDRYFSLLFPGGAGYFTDGDTSGQPARMELLAKLFERKLHPKLTEQQCTAYAARVRVAAQSLKDTLTAAEGPCANLELLRRVRTALGRAVQFELVNLKRAFKIEGLSETQVHEVIPDRPSVKKAAKEPKPTAP